MLKLIFWSVLAFAATDAYFQLSVIHLNDFHARFEQTTPKSAPCRPGEEATCIGGIARVVTEIKRLLRIRPNPILLNAGDNYQGTLYFNLFGYKLTADVLNTLPFDAHTIGNHEFDKYVEGLVPFLRELNAPVVVANMDDTAHPELRGLYQKSVVVKIAGKKIGIIGVIYPKTDEISNSENLRFLDESHSVNMEADRLTREENVFTVIVLSHCGYELDMEIARRARPIIGLIVGAHSHTLLYRGEAPDVAVGGSKVGGTYPSIIKRRDGGNVYVVQAACYTKYLGSITVKYDAHGQVVGWVSEHNNDGLPIYMGHDIKPDPEMMEYLLPFIKKVHEYGNQKIGETEYTLDQDTCSSAECTLGDMITDAMLTMNITEDALASFMNAGGLRTPIPAGDILYYDLASAQPFENSFDAAIMTGKGLRACAEQMALPYLSWNVNMLQVAGVKITLDLTKPEGERVVKLEIRDEPQSDNYVNVIDEKEYKVSVVNFLLTGGDGFTCFPEYVLDQQKGYKDIDVVAQFITDNSPLSYQTEGRIEIITE